MACGCHGFDSNCHLSFVSKHKISRGHCFRFHVCSCLFICSFIFVSFSANGSRGRRDGKVAGEQAEEKLEVKEASWH